MAKRELPSPDVLRQLLDYDSETGKFTWRQRDRCWSSSDREHSRWNSRYAGTEALTALGGHADGKYRQGHVLTHPVMAHRVAYAIVHGIWPDEVDHVNGDRTDNRIVNLRIVTRRQNSQNRSMGKRNTSGHLGVFWCRRSQKWTAGITADGKKVSLGSFHQKEMAIAARQAAERKYGFHENHGRQQRRA